MPKSQRLRPVFLHGLWRCGSTYVWSRFRALDNTLCFYEPLHHGLTRLTHKRIADDVPELYTNNHHPAMEESYFAEYAPLLKGRGVSGLQRDFEWKKFVLTPSDDYEALRRYIASLNKHTQYLGLTPVLGFNRTNLRISWLKHNFPDAVHIYIDRAPYEIWSSYERLAQSGNRVFYVAWLRILHHNRSHPLIRPLIKHLNFAGPGLRIKTKMYYKHYSMAMKPEDLYMMVFYLWALSTLHAASQNIIVLDMNRADEPGYIDTLTATIEQRTGLHPFFDDIQKKPILWPKQPAFLRAEEEALALLKPLLALPFFVPERLATNLAAWHAEKTARLAKTIS